MVKIIAGVLVNIQSVTNALAIVSIPYYCLLKYHLMIFVDLYFISMLLFHSVSHLPTLSRQNG
jgi:hypothetical protein